MIDVAALVEAIAADSDALERLAAALAARTGNAEHQLAELTTKQAASQAGLHERTIRRALAAGTLTGCPVAGRWRIHRDKLDAWLHAGAPTSAAPTHHNGRLTRAAGTAGADAIAGRSATS
jgi:excisionase family DNA binding protein